MPAMGRSVCSRMRLQFITDKDGAAWINRSGCSAMAKGGSGDVLTGVIAGLLARGMDGAEAAAFGVYVHGRAGEYAAAALGENSVLATDLADSILKEALNRENGKTPETAK